ncbi:hypothetical protein BT93_B1601 [Corymbia citriodora subsp. variegata]|nr:hypothetical protein BT93_B1601 [Corymbia citriodora subsp. variegata]
MYLWGLVKPQDSDTLCSPYENIRTCKGEESSNHRNFETERVGYWGGGGFFVIKKAESASFRFSSIANRLKNWGVQYGNLCISWLVSGPAADRSSSLIIL